MPTLQIKRKNTLGQGGQLQPGELAYNQLEDILYIGNYTANEPNVPIGESRSYYLMMKSIFGADYVPKESVVVSSTGPLNEETSITWAMGVDHRTLTAQAAGIITIDGHQLKIGERVLLRHGLTAAGLVLSGDDRTEDNIEPVQVNSYKNNGIFIVTTEGTAGEACVLTRAEDLDISAEFVPGVVVDVADGTVNKDKVYALKNIYESFTMGEDPVFFDEPTIDIGSLGVDFLALSDTPDSYANQSGKLLAVGDTGVIFTDIIDAGEWE